MGGAQRETVEREENRVGRDVWKKDVAVTGIVCTRNNKWDKGIL
jgi:hypothetical protein